MDLFDKYKSELILSVGDILSNMSKECEKIAEKDSGEEILYESRTRFLKIKVVRNKSGIYFTRSFGNKNKSSKITKKTKFSFDFNRKQEVETSFDVKSGASSEESGPYATIEVDQDGSMTINYSEMASNIETNIEEINNEIEDENELKQEFTNINSQLSQIIDNQNKMIQSMQTQYDTIQAEFQNYANIFLASINNLEKDIEASVNIAEQTFEQTLENAMDTLEKDIDSGFNNLANEMNNEFNQLEMRL